MRNLALSINNIANANPARRSIALSLSQSGNRVMWMLDDFPALWDRLTHEEKKRLIRKMM